MVFDRVWLPGLPYKFKPYGILGHRHLLMRKQMGLFLKKNRHLKMLGLPLSFKFDWGC